VPKTLESYLHQTLLDIVEETTKQKPEYLLVVFMGIYLSYGERGKNISAMAAALAARRIYKDGSIY
jgi:hypothetical protein